MFGIGKAKAEKKKKSQAQAFEEFKTLVIAAVTEAKRNNVWDTNLGAFLQRYGDALAGGR